MPILFSAKLTFSNFSQTWSGGSVPTKLGNFMTDAGVKLTPIFGGTEFGAPTYLKRRPGGYGDWEWITMDERVKIRWDPQGDGTYECQFLVRLLDMSNCHFLIVNTLLDHA